MDWVPIVLFLVIGAVLCTYLYLRYRARQGMLDTLRFALQQGQELSPQVLEAMSGDLQSAQRDLRKGVIWLALAAGLAVMSWAVGERDLLGPAALPLMLGIAYLILWRFAGRQD